MEIEEGLGIKWTKTEELEDLGLEQQIIRLIRMFINSASFEGEKKEFRNLPGDGSYNEADHLEESSI